MNNLPEIKRTKFGTYSVRCFGMDGFTSMIKHKRLKKQKSSSKHPLSKFVGKEILSV